MRWRFWHTPTLEELPHEYWYRCLNGHLEISPVAIGGWACRECAATGLDECYPLPWESRQAPRSWSEIQAAYTNAVKGNP